LKQADASLERGLAIREAAYGPDHPEVATALTNLGLVQMRLRKLEEARVSLDRARGDRKGDLLSRSSQGHKIPH